jgi:hypothetical protein
VDIPLYDLDPKKVRRAVDEYPTTQDNNTDNNCDIHYNSHQTNLGLYASHKNTKGTTPSKAIEKKKL